MRNWTLGIGLFAIVAAISLAIPGHSQVKDPAQGGTKPPPPTGKQVLMRDKLTYAKDALDGLAVEDFAKVAHSAEMLRMISRASSWYVLDSEEYDRYSKDFQEQAADLERHAKARNLDAATLDYVRISLTCVQCHKHVRAVRARQKP
jgi:hypothetical protein